MTLWPGRNCVAVVLLLWWVVVRKLFPMCLTGDVRLLAGPPDRVELRVSVVQSHLVGPAVTERGRRGRFVNGRDLRVRGVVCLTGMTERPFIGSGRHKSH